jgi:hypothetical protein
VSNTTLVSNAILVSSTVLVSITILVSNRKNHYICHRNLKRVDRGKEWKSRRRISSNCAGHNKEFGKHRSSYKYRGVNSSNVHTILICYAKRP